MGYFVFNGVKLECSMGDMESYLEVPDPEGAGFISGEKAANIKDCIPILNIRPFGRCKSPLYPPTASATALNFGVLQPMPCTVPNIIGDKWENWEESGLYIRGAPVLMHSATLNCIFSGTIAITENIREGLKTGALGIDADVLKDPEVNFGPGTKYIDEYGKLLYERNDGLGGTVRIVLRKDYDLLRSLLIKSKTNGTLNVLDNEELLNIGMTGEQYTKQKAFGTIEKNAYKEGYEVGYSGDKDRIYKKRIQITAAEGLGSGGEPGLLGDIYLDYCKLGIDEGLEDYISKHIDRFNPTSRIDGPALINII